MDIRDFWFWRTLFIRDKKNQTFTYFESKKSQLLLKNAIFLSKMYDILIVTLLLLFSDAVCGIFLNIKLNNGAYNARKTESQQRAYFQSKDYCNEEIMDALKLLESHYLKDLEQSNMKQRKITEFL